MSLFWIAIGCVIGFVSAIVMVMWLAYLNGVFGLNWSTLDCCEFDLEKESAND